MKVKCHILQKLFESKQKIYSFAWKDDYLFMADIKKNISVWKCEAVGHCKKISAINLEQNVGEILPLKFGSITLLFLSLANGFSRVLRFNKENEELNILPDKIWQV